jgi:hypothetical protein
MHAFARAVLLGYIGYWTYIIVQQDHDLWLSVRSVCLIVAPAILGYLSVNRSPPKGGM